MEWIRDDPVRQHGNAACLHLGWTGQAAFCASSVAMGTLAIFIGISGTSLSSFDLSIDLHVTQALFVTRRRHQLTRRPHLPAAKDPSHSMKSSIIACSRHEQPRLTSTCTVPFARTWTTLQDATCGVRHIEVLNVVTRLEVESSDSHSDLYAHLGTMAHSDVVCAGSSPSCNGVLSVYPMTFQSLQCWSTLN